LNLLADNQIPTDANVIVVAGPRQPLAESEISQLSLYVANGGALLVMEEPTLMTDFGDVVDPMSTYLVETWGIQLGNDFVVDQSSNQPSVAVGSQWSSHQITQNLTGYVTVMPSTRSVTLLEPPAGVSQTSLLSTSARAWAETDLEALKSQNAQIEPDQGVDLIGPVSIAALAENFESKGKVVVYGDVDFLSNGFYLSYGNGDLFVNSIDWAAGQEQLINLTPKDTTQRLLLPPQKVTLNLILLGTVCLIPGSMIIVGIVVWFLKRKKG
jgi:ABC-type uncharacterized transport system involved in gliding motility auxiliary subunit